MLDVIQVDHVNKKFLIRKQKSLKETVIYLAKPELRPESFPALDDVSLSIESGESVGLIGPNGSGKSTLLKTIGGILTPDSGRVLVRGRIAALLELGAGFHADLTGRENIYLNAAVLGISKHETDKYFDEIVEFSGIPDFIDTQVKFYSSGMYVRLAFSVAVHVDPDILLVDEVLAVGDEPFQKKCMDKIAEFQQDGRTIVFVSHSSGQVAEVCERAIMLDQGRVIEDGPSEVALGRLHEQYQELIAATRTASALRSQYRATLESVEFSNGKQTVTGDDPLDFRPGEDLHIHGTASFSTLTPNWILHIKLTDQIGAVYIQISSRDTLEQRLPDGTSHTVFDVVFPDLRLPAGDYLVDIGVYDVDSNLLAGTDRVGRFVVTANTRTNGPVYSDVRLEVRSS